MNKVQTKWGISNIRVGNLELTTIKLKVKSSFPVELLPDGVNYYVNSKGYFIITHEVLSIHSRGVIKSIVDLLKNHSFNQVNAKYDRMQNPIAYDHKMMGADVDHYFDFAEL